MSNTNYVAVFGATTHIGQLLVEELRGRGIAPVAIVSGDSAPTDTTDLMSAERALAVAAVVVNCAEPFPQTTEPILRATLEAGLPYLDVCTDVESIATVLNGFRSDAEHVGVAAVPALSVLGGLAELLVSAILGEQLTADSLDIVHGVRGWSLENRTPDGGRTLGPSSRLIWRFANGSLQAHQQQPRERAWPLPHPWGHRQVALGVSWGEVELVPNHHLVNDIRCYTTVDTVDAIGDSPHDLDAPPEHAFMIDVVATLSDGTQRRGHVSGNDLALVTARLAAEAAERIIDGRTRRTGSSPAGAIFDPVTLLQALAPHLDSRLPSGPSRGEDIVEIDHEPTARGVDRQTATGWIRHWLGQYFDHLLAEHGFTRRTRSVVYSRKLAEGTQRIAFDYGYGPITPKTPSGYRSSPTSCCPTSRRP